MSDTNTVTINNLNQIATLSNDDLFVIYDVDENNNEPTKQVSLGALKTNIGIPSFNGDSSQFLNGRGTWSTPQNTTYDVVSTSFAGLVPIIRTDTSIQNQAAIFSVDPNGLDAKWVSISNNNFRANTSYGGTIGPLSNNSYQVLNGKGEWINYRTREYLSFNTSTANIEAIEWNLGSNRGVAMNRLVQITHSDDISLGLLRVFISDSSVASSAACHVKLVNIGGSTNLFTNLNISTRVTANNNFFIKMERLAGAGAHRINFIGLSDNPTLFTRSNGTTGNVTYSQYN